MQRLQDLATARSFWPAVFGAYFAAQALLRIGHGDKMNIDEAEAWLWAQNLAWGYGPQPPLYIWLQAAVFALTGANAAGLAVLKFLLLWGIFLAATGLARRWSATLPDAGWIAGTAALSLFWLPELVWESQRIRTHNVLAALLALLAVWQLLRLLADPRRTNHMLLGLLLGLGLVAKWNFAIFAAALVAAPLLSRDRPRMLRPAAIWLVVLPAAIIAPTLAWMLAHPDIAFASQGKLGIAGGPASVAALGVWLAAAGKGAFTFAILPLLVLGGFALFAGKRGGASAALTEAARGEMRIVIGIVALALILVLVSGAVSGATQLKTRWLLPLVLPAFPVAGLWLVMRLHGSARRGFVATTMALPAVLLAGMAYMLRLDPPAPGFDASAAAAALPRNDASHPYLTVAELAANLEARAPDRVVTDPAVAMAAPCPAGVAVLEPALVLRRDVIRWLAACGLRPAGLPAPLEGGGLAVQHYVRG